ncbi:creatininase [Clostridium sp. AM58-1XD]|uniref:creatininase n=1 Tax=Clostridium sp. AM58-1XD TaxID=2292307 RepID=UPI000E4CF697|nr:creatininase [Clostridium sp. AM58-1XD]RGZ00685.1 creatininase [Clostridium sp. AM58-1XD]
MRTRLMEEMTWKEVEEAIQSNTGVLLPIGATEQHGYHLPISTDVILPKRMGLSIAEETNLLVAPPIAYGFRSRPGSGGGQTFPATTSLRGTTLIALITDILREFVRSGFRKIVLLNWHMENSGFVYEAAFLVCEEMKEKYPDLKILVFESAFDTLKEESMEKIFEGQFPTWAIEHASIFETSLMMYIVPELVQFDKAVNDCAEDYPYYDVLPIQSRYVPQSGTLWKARMASREKGELAWKEVHQMLVRNINKEFV